MKVADRIRNYITEQKVQGSFRPGDKLPSYNTFMGMFDVSYLTVSSAINKLAKEGLVETRKGSGSYLAGAKKLKVLFNIVPSTISIENFRKLLKKHLANADLHIDIEIRNIAELDDPAVVQRTTHEYKAAISIQMALTYERELPASPLIGFPDYNEVIGNLETVDNINYEACLPFAYCALQTGVNLNLLKKTGYKLADLTPDYDWWDDFVAKCRRVNIAPMSVDYKENYSTIFSQFLPLLMSWHPYDDRKCKGPDKIFDTPEGRKLLKIISDCEFIVDHQNDKRSFFLNGAVLYPGIGSWLTVQNLTPEYPGKRVENLGFLPYNMANGKKLCPFSSNNLTSYMRPDITIDERNRVWELMKIMVSREFQIDYCNISGDVSSTRDILPTEYFWNRQNGYSGFFPNKDDWRVPSKSIFSISKISSLSTLLENYRFYGQDAEETLKRMDIKKSAYGQSS